jgi:hypothetical protein
MHTSREVEVGLNSLESRYLETVIYTKAQLNNRLVGHTLLDKTQINTGLPIAVLKAISYNL